MKNLLINFFTLLLLFTTAVVFNEFMLGMMDLTGSFLLGYLDTVVVLCVGVVVVREGVRGR